MADDISTEFFAIANDLATREANDYLDERMAALEKWVQAREEAGEPADLRSLISQVMNEPNQRGPLIVGLCTAMWRLRERNADANHSGTV